MLFKRLKITNKFKTYSRSHSKLTAKNNSRSLGPEHLLGGGEAPVVDGEVQYLGEEPQPEHGGGGGGAGGVGEQGGGGGGDGGGGAGRFQVLLVQVLQSDGVDVLLVDL